MTAEEQLIDALSDDFGQIMVAINDVEMRMLADLRSSDYKKKMAKLAKETSLELLTRLRFEVQT